MRHAILQNQMAVDFLTADGGRDTCATAKFEYCMYIPDPATNISVAV